MSLKEKKLGGTCRLQGIITKNWRKLFLSRDRDIGNSHMD